jgi:hypothetical protein
MKKLVLVVLAIVSFVIDSKLYAQLQGVDSQGRLVITSAVPFLRVNPDGRSGAMGDVGMALSPDANAVFSNTARMAFMETDYGVSLTFVPWLRGIANDVYMADLVGYYNIKKKQTIAASLRYFSLGQIQFTDINGTELNSVRPVELAFDLNYARQLTDRFGLAIGLRYINSNLGSTDTDRFVSQAAGADISMFHTNPIKTKKLEGAKINWGLAITNIGSKMSYSANALNKDFIPANFALGVGAEIQIDEYNKFGIYTDVNKLLIPTPVSQDLEDGTTNPDYDADNNGLADYKEKSSIGGLFSSFGDAPGGFQEEMAEFTIGIGAEYTYNDLFMLRAGYFYENPTKGARKFLSAGVGLKYSVAQLNFAYVIPTTAQRNPLDNTMRFTLLFDFVKGGGGGTAPAAIPQN